jgi:hypothetical protein
MEERIILTGEPICDVIPTCDTMPMVSPNECPQCTCGECNNDISMEDAVHDKFIDLATILQESVLYSWKMHLKAKKYSVHMILEEYYEEALDIIDGLIEQYQGICKCDIVKCDVRNNTVGGDDPISYFTNLKNYVSDFTNDSSNFNDRTFEIKSDIDDLLRLIDSTLYATVKTFSTLLSERFLINSSLLSLYFSSVKCAWVSINI